jgi:von Willebrand factor type A domain
VRGSLTFLTPSAGLLAVVALLPLAALVIAGRHVRRVRAVLRLGAPVGGGVRWRQVAVVGVPLLIALALMQPALRRHGSVSTRTDAGVFVVVDTSSSMAAASSAHAPSRLAQARRIARAVGSQLPGIPLGVATFTDRVLPDLFPTTDAAVFNSTIDTLRIASPPPRETSRVATNFSALAALGSADFFSRLERHRALLLITDGESAAFDSSTVARALAASPGVHVVVVRVGGGADRLYAANGRPGGAYRADPARASQAISQLVAATGGRAFTAGSAGVASALRADLGSGPTTRIASRPETRTLAPFILLVALGVLLLVLVPRRRAGRAPTRPARASYTSALSPSEPEGAGVVPSEP